MKPARVWPALLIGPIAFAMFGPVEKIFGPIAHAIHSEIEMKAAGANSLTAIVATTFESPILFLLSHPRQTVVFGGALVAAILSPVAWKKRLGLTRSRHPTWTWPILALATVFVGLAAGIAMNLMFPEGEQAWEEPGFGRPLGRRGH